MTRARHERAAQICGSLALGIAVLALWEFFVRHFDVPVFVLPAPSAIWTALVENFASLMAIAVDDVARDAGSIRAGA
jgi:ABC-type nitrate/sulfonate/bicarbonate transport system permease component